MLTEVMTKVRETLPASYFYDPLQYRRELDAVWYREWLCLGREEDWPATGDFRRVRVGDEQIIVTRADDGELHAFHNTCRHRGSVLCEVDSGAFRNGRIVCPYHAWSYSLSGELKQAPRTTKAEGIRPEDFSLYGVALEVWRGFVFVNLDPSPATSLQQSVKDEAANVAAWPLEDLRAVHSATHRLACNWKIFWENYVECYHCPGVHPDLCRLVPIYRTGYTEYADAGVEPDPERPHSMLSRGSLTWSADGTTFLPWFDGLGEKEKEAGVTFATFQPTMFLVAHVDYVRSVRLVPIGPEETDLIVDWYVHQDSLDLPELDVDRLVAFASQVVSEDARVCELNQQGIRCGRHERGVLTELENPVFEFEQWVRDRLGELAG
jgi:Rieske 2Fe-2S family protein